MTFISAARKTNHNHITNDLKSSEEYGGVREVETSQLRRASGAPCTLSLEQGIASVYDFTRLKKSVSIAGM